MKKNLLFILTLVLGMAYCQAQSNDSLEYQRQQRELQQRQNKEMQDLMNKQTKEQEKAAKAAAKAEEERMQQAAKEQKAAEKAENDRIKQQKRDEAAAKKAEQERKKAEQERKKAERRAKIGRGSRFTLEASFETGRSTAESFSPYSNTSEALAVGINYHYPLSKRWDLVSGIGAKVNNFNFKNSIQVNGDQLTFTDSVPAITPQASLQAISFELPILLSHVSGNENKKRELFLGLNLGYRVFNNISINQFNAQGTATEIFNSNNIPALNPFHADVVLGIAHRTKLTTPAIMLHLNLVPTFVPGMDGKKVHEFGIIHQF